MAGPGKRTSKISKTIAPVASPFPTTLTGNVNRPRTPLVTATGAAPILTAARISFALSLDEVIVTCFTIGTHKMLPMMSGMMTGGAEIILRRSKLTAAKGGE